MFVEICFRDFFRNLFENLFGGSTSNPRTWAGISPEIHWENCPQISLIFWSMGDLINSSTDSYMEFLNNIFSIFFRKSSRDSSRYFSWNSEKFILEFLENSLRAFSTKSSIKCIKNLSRYSSWISWTGCLINFCGILESCPEFPS